MDYEQRLKMAEFLRENSLKEFDYWKIKLRGEVMHIQGRNGAIRVLVYMPSEGEGPFPVVFDLHGGGWVINDAEVDDGFCHLLRKQLGAVLISINYAKAPEKPYPAALEDIDDAIKYFIQNAEKFNIDTSRMAIGGHSAGGNLATVIALKANISKEYGFKCQYLDCIATDLSQNPSAKHKIPEAIPAEVMDFFITSYCTLEQTKTPFVSPLLATDEMLKGMPPTIILTAELDSLAPEVEEYAYRLIRCGVPVVAKRQLGATHCYPLYFGTEHSKTACELLIKSIKMFL